MAADAETRCAGRVAIVTGGSRGVGRAVACRLSASGHPVVVNYSANQRCGDAVVEEILAASGIALAVRGDVADELDVERLFSETTEAFGGVDVVVHAAELTIAAAAADLDLDVFDALQRTNARGTFVINREAARQLRDGGAIVNLSAAAVDPAVPGSAAYAASKACVDAITRALAVELRGRDISVNSVALGPGHATDLTGVAELVAFLVSSSGHAVTGQVVRAMPGAPR